MNNSWRETRRWESNEILKDVSNHDGIDIVNHPPHYNLGKIEVFDVLDDWSEAGMISYCVSNVIKYCARYRHKADPLQDLLKAKWYLEKEIAKYADEG